MADVAKLSYAVLIMKHQVDTVVPLLVNDEAVQNLNAAIPSWASDQNQTESPIYVNDIYPFPNTALRDGVHPNASGDKKMAAVWKPGLIQALEAAKADKAAALKEREVIFAA